MWYSLLNASETFLFTILPDTIFTPDLISKFSFEAISQPLLAISIRYGRVLLVKA